MKGYSELSGAFSKCTNCHDSALTNATDRQAAPADVNYDTYVTATEKTDILTWAQCDTPQ